MWRCSRECKDPSPRLAKDHQGWLESRRREGGWTESPSEPAEGSALQMLADCGQVNLSCVKPPMYGVVMAAPASPLSLHQIPGNTHTLFVPINPAGQDDPQGSPPLTLPTKPLVGSSLVLSTSWGQLDPARSLVPSLRLGPQLDSPPGLWAGNQHPLSPHPIMGARSKATLLSKQTSPPVSSTRPLSDA